jgi:hypothetical protein
MAVQAPAAGGQEDRALDPLPHGQVDGPSGTGRQWDGDELAALTEHRQSAVAALQGQCLDVGTSSF